jgi:glyoxylase-like metal-dependent hydrolase (beta-lactamase superfamily II)
MVARVGRDTIEHMSDAPRGQSAAVTVLSAGYVGPRTASTVAYVEDGALRLVIDPGMVADRRAAILAPLLAAGAEPDDITDVVFSHHHPDHTINAALFPNARYHDHWAVYFNDVWTDRDAEGFELSESVRLIRTPGHTSEDITTLVGTADGVVAFTHVWWNVDGPAVDPYAEDGEALSASRERVLAVADLVVPGHGAPFVPSSTTPR